MGKIEVVILDWAGTLVDYGSMASVEAYKDLFKYYEISIDEAEIRQSMGIDKIHHIRKMLELDNIKRQWLSRFKVEPNEGDVMELNRHFERMIINKLVLFSEPKEFVKSSIDTLRESGIMIGSTTSYTHEMMDILVPILAKKGITVDLIVNSEDVRGEGRPYPYMIFKTMEKLGISSVKSVIKLGDTINDIKEGKNAGVVTVGVIDGSSEMGMSYAQFEALTKDEKRANRQRVKESLLTAGADYVVENIMSLPYIIAKINNNR